MDTGANGRRMRLTADHVAKVRREIPDPGFQPVASNARPATDADYAAVVDGILAAAPEGDFWVFAYGSLIWNPDFDFDDRRVARVRGWRRAFCLGWDHRFRGIRDTPGLMLALDRGGQCTGVVYRLPAASLEANLHRLIRREMSMVPSAFPPRFIGVEAGGERHAALTFAIDRRSGRYIGGLDAEAIADVLSTACGFRGSMAEYLFSTVSHLEELGIHDRHLWRLQELVAERIERMG
jgi:cation transport protein ChaC